MIQLFEIKKKIKKEDNELLNKYSEISKKTGEEVLKELIILLSTNPCHRIIRKRKIKI